MAEKPFCLILVVAFLCFIPAALAESDASDKSVKVYSVRELVEILKTKPDTMRGRKYRLKAFVVDKTKGMGCSSSARLIDKSDLPNYQNAYNYLTDPKYSTVARKKLEAIPTLESGPYITLGDGVPTGASPTRHGVYDGHFFDQALIQHCGKESWKRIVLDEQVEDLTTKEDEDNFWKGFSPKLN